MQIPEAKKLPLVVPKHARSKRRLLDSCHSTLGAPYGLAGTSRLACMHFDACASSRNLRLRTSESEDLDLSHFWGPLPEVEGAKIIDTLLSPRFHGLETQHAGALFSATIQRTSKNIWYEVPISQARRIIPSLATAKRK